MEDHSVDTQRGRFLGDSGSVLLYSFLTILHLPLGGHLPLSPWILVLFFGIGPLSSGYLLFASLFWLWLPILLSYYSCTEGSPRSWP